jgi:cytidylate kinase
MVAIFLDGESKSGKTAVGRHIKEVLETGGYKTRLVVAGYFFRTIALLVLQRGFDEQSDESLTAVIRSVLESPEMYDEISEADLHSPEIDAWVSRIAQLESVQSAAQDWRERSAQKALGDGIEVVLLDGRNLRSKLANWAAHTQTKVALELIIFCRPEVAAQRYLSDAGNMASDSETLQAATAMITERREMDRDRAEAAYQDAVDPVILRPGEVQATDALHDAFDASVANPPRPILFDNSDVPLADGLLTVESLADAAIQQMK